MCRTLPAFLLLLLVATNAWAQATAQINGTVADSSGGVLPGATVVAIQTDTGFRREAVTDDTGSYTLSNLPIGPYRLEVTLVRLPHLRADRHRAAGQQQPGHSRDAAARRARGNGVGRSVRAARRDAQPCHRRVIDNERIEALPLEGRNPATLIVLAGAAVGHGRPVQPQHDDEPRHRDRRRPAVRRRLPARRRDAQQRATTASTCRCRSPTRCRSSASRPARRTRRTASRPAARSAS